MLICSTKMFNKNVELFAILEIIISMKDNEVTDSIFAFRVSKKDKSWLNKELANLKEMANKVRADGTRVINKNDLLLDALRIGLDKVKKKYSKTSE